MDSLNLAFKGKEIFNTFLSDEIFDYSYIVDESRDTLDSSTSRQTADGGLGDALDVVTKYLAVTLGASLAESLASFTTSSHCCSSDDTDAIGCAGTILIADPALVAIVRVRNRVLHHPIMAGLAAAQPYLHCCSLLQPPAHHHCQKTVGGLSRGPTGFLDGGGYACSAMSCHVKSILLKKRKQLLQQGTLNFKCKIF